MVKKKKKLKTQKEMGVRRDTISYTSTVVSPTKMHFRG